MRKKCMSLAITALVCFGFAACTPVTDPNVINNSPYYYEMADETIYGHLLTFQEGGVLEEKVISAVDSPDDLTYATISGKWEVKEVEGEGKYIVVRYDLGSFHDEGNGYADELRAFFEGENQAVIDLLKQNTVYGFGPYLVDEDGDLVNAKDPDDYILLTFTTTLLLAVDTAFDGIDEDSLDLLLNEEEGDELLGED